MRPPGRSFNGYGLFAVMTTERPEIIIEGSNDREHKCVRKPRDGQPYGERW